MRVAIVSLGLALTLAGCANVAPAEVIQLYGSVESSYVTISVPQLQGSHQLLVQASQLGRVEAGKTIAGFDDRMLTAQKQIAEADAATAAAAVALLEHNISEVEKSQDKLTKNRRTIESSIENLNANSKNLARQRAQLVENIKKLTALRSHYQKSMNEVAKIPFYDSYRKQLQKAINGLTAQINQAQAALKQLDAARAKMGQGVGQANSGLDNLSSSSAELKELKAELQQLRKAAESGVVATQIGVELANYQLGQAQIVAPVSGTIVQIASPGQILPNGAQLAVIDPDTPKHVTAWATPEQREQFCVGSKATITATWLPGEAISGTVVSLGNEAKYPPTFTISKDIHLMRAYQVEIETEQSLPAGLFVDISIPAERNCNG
ncbi:MAG: HlyD family efflux transporter periplasmic adaptor subunit [Propionibacteriaceae bacterium]|nr:HlyD family efflux transporter periplasmic adaptor subunit [Propionibacteriaceae bacterium]